MRSPLAAVACALVLAAAPVATFAGDAPQSAVLVPGAHVRIYSTQLRLHPVEGILVSLDDEVLRVRADGEPFPMALHRRSIRRVEVSTGGGNLSSEGANAGAIVFGLAGGALGLLAGAMGNLDCENHCSSGLPIFGAALGATGGVVVGGLLGGLIGWAVPADRWQTVSQSRVRVRIGPAKGGGAAASVTVRF